MRTVSSFLVVAALCVAATGTAWPWFARDCPTYLSAPDRGAGGGGGPPPRDPLIPVARRLIGTSTGVAAGLLPHATFGPRYRALLEAGLWLETAEGREVIARTAALLEAEELRVARATVGLNSYDASAVTALLEENPDIDVPDIAPAARREATRQARAATPLFRQALRDALDAGVDAVELFRQAAREVAAANTSRASGYRDEFALLMTTYVPLGADFVRPEHLFNFIDFMDNNARWRNRIVETVTVLAREHHRAIERLQRFFSTQYPWTRRSQNPFLRFVVRRQERFMQRVILGPTLISPDVYAALEAVIEEGLDAVPELMPAINHRADRALARQITRFYITALSREYLPEPYGGVTTEALRQFLFGVIASQGRAQAVAYVHERDRPAPTARPATTPPPSSPSSPPTTTRAERIAAHRALELERMIAAEAAAAAASTAPEPAAPATPARAAPPSSTLAVDDVERAVSTRSITEQRAESILTFYTDELSDQERQSFRESIGQLLERTQRRLSTFSNGEISALHGPGEGIYEVRIQGIHHPIRVYFGIHPVHGPMLLAAHYKRNQEQQHRVVENANRAWRQYLRDN